MAAQLLVFPLGPKSQVTIQLAHRRVECRGIVSPIVADPTPDDRVEHAEQIFDRLVTAFRQIPASNLRPNGGSRFIGDCRTERTFSSIRLGNVGSLRRLRSICASMHAAV